MIKAVIFDWGGTCSIGNHMQYVKQRIAEKFGLPLERVDAAVEKNNAAYLTGQIRGEDFFFQLNKVLATSFTITDFEKTFAAIKLNLRVLDLIRQVRKRCKTGLLSDNYKEMVEFIRKKITLTEYFDVAVFSNEAGIKKPDRKIFELATAKLGVKPQDCVFVDDREDNIFTARNMGMAAIKFEGSEKLEAGLRNAGVL